MAEDNSKLNTKSEDTANGVVISDIKGVAIGDNNIVYNYYGYREEVKVEPVADDDLPCPYRGLYHFTPNDAEYFFGREVFIETLFQATQTRNFIPVLGASGSGKSSVVLAGLIPKLEKEGNWKFTHFRPGSDPFHALALALVPLYTPDLDETDQIAQTRKLASYLNDNTVSLSDVFDKIQQNSPNNRLLLIADQFEELYTQCSDHKVRRRFLDCLLTCFQFFDSGVSSSTVLVTTMRADFLTNALSFRPFADMLQNADIKIGAMSREELTAAIEKPAEKLGVTFEAGLVESILNEVEDEPGNLPLLEFALTELWKKRTGKQLTHEAYKEIGYIKGALAKYAEQKYLELDKDKQEKARQVFIKLVNFGNDNNNTKRLVNRDQIGEDNWKLITSKNGLADSRLVVTNQDNKNSETVEVVHEALISNWERLGQWLDDDRDHLKQRRKIEDAAKEWQDLGKKNEDLLTNKKLKFAKDFQREYQEKYPLSDLTINFIAESYKYHKNQQLKSWGLYSIIPLVAIFIGGYFSVREIQLNGLVTSIEDCVGKEICHDITEPLQKLVKAKKSLKSYNLSKANLEDANLEGANLEGANLKDANLGDANLEGANLKDANLEDAYLSGANLKDANLEGANLKDATLDYTELEGANLHDTDFSGARLFFTNLSGAFLPYSNFSNASLHHVNLSDTYLRLADFSDTYLRLADFSGADLSYAKFSGAFFDHSNFSDAALIDISNFTYSQIKLGCNWESAIYKGNYDENQEKWIVDEAANQEYIKQLEQDTASNPEREIVCGSWQE